jgi:hypothetical protein
MRFQLFSVLTCEYQILDPQSAVLTNSEVLSFMRAHPPRKPDPRVGAYPVTDMRGLWSIQKEVWPKSLLLKLRIAATYFHSCSKAKSCAHLLR